MEMTEVWVVLVVWVWRKKKTWWSDAADHPQFLHSTVIKLSGLTCMESPEASGYENKETVNNGTIII